MTAPAHDEGRGPRLAAGVRLHHDGVRGRWVLLAPERVLVLNAMGRTIIELCDGSADIAAIVDELAGRFEAPREVIESQTKAFLGELADRRMMA